MDLEVKVRPSCAPARSYRRNHLSRNHGHQLALAAGLPAVILAYSLLGRAPQPAQPVQPTVASDDIRKFKLLLYDADGNPLRVSHISTRKQ